MVGHIQRTHYFKWERKTNSDEIVKKIDCLYVIGKYFKGDEDLRKLGY